MLLISFTFNPLKEHRPKGSLGKQYFVVMLLLAIAVTFGFKLREGEFRMDISNKFFTVRVGRSSNRLLREVMDDPSLETVRVRLYGSLRA